VSFPTKVDTWLVLVLISAIVACFAMAVVVYRRQQTVRAAVGALAGLAMVVAFWSAFDIDYEVTDGQLIVHRGPMISATIPISAIERVRPSRESMNAPAASMDRLRIDHPSHRGHRGRNFLLVSPKDKDGFLNALAAVDPRLKRRGNELLR
jgi:hypothetical protein